MSKLEFNHYGKHQVRLLRVRRKEAVHEVAEWEADVLLEGSLGAAYLTEDNTSIVPTDTVKNTVLALAHDLEDVTRDAFALALAEHFPGTYSHFSACEVEVRERRWERMIHAGVAHPHSFVRDANGRSFSAVRVEKGKPARRAGGIRGMVIMKTAGSGFSGYAKDEWTTLVETNDRILATSMDARWDYAGDAADLEEAVIAVMLKTFSETYSPSLQRTLYQMGETALAEFPGLERIRLTMPNKHYLNLDLTKWGRPGGQKRIFLPTDEPFGFIEAVVGR